MLMEINNPEVNNISIFSQKRSNDLSLTLFFEAAHGLNPDLIENSKVLRSLIDYQFDQ